jgi:hypothetical protein
MTTLACVATILVGLALGLLWFVAYCRKCHFRNVKSDDAELLAIFHRSVTQCGVKQFPDLANEHDARALKHKFKVKLE